MIDPTYIEGSLPLVSKVLKGEDVKFYEEGFPEISLREVGTKTPSSYNGFDRVTEGKWIAVIPVHGAITKYDQYCGPSGMLTFIDQIKSADRNPNITAIVLDIDSGGGEASIIETVAKTIQSIDTPIISYYNNILASAAYYIAASTDEIYASEDTDIVGSIGVMVTFADYRGYFEKEGVKIHEVYSKYSTEKNKIWIDAREGKYESLQAKILNPYAEAFINSVKSQRVGISETAFKGSTWMTKEAIEMKLITGQKTFDEVLARAEELGENYSKSKNELTMEGKTFSNITANVTGDFTQNEDGTFSFSSEQMDQIEAALNSEEPAVEKPQDIHAAEAQKAEFEESVNDAVAKALEPMEAMLKEQAAKIKLLSGEPAAEAETAKDENGDEFQDKPKGDVVNFNDPNLPWNQMAAELGHAD